jgi:hypothetical protein
MADAVTAKKKFRESVQLPTRGEELLILAELVDAEDRR